MRTLSVMDSGEVRMLTRSSLEGRGTRREILKRTPGNGVAGAKLLELPSLMSSDTSLLQVMSNLFFFYDDGK